MRVLSAAVCLVMVATVSAQLPDVGLHMAQLVAEHGYPITEHFVQTSDDYTLGLFNIPYGKAGPDPAGSPKRPAVLLQHGLLDSSTTWVNNAPSESLGFILADHGYDVWLGNSRGNTYSTIPANPPASYWQFTWDQMAMFDLPANVEYILHATGHSSISYVGHSQGTTQAFAGLSLYPELQKQVNFFGALAPVAYVDHETSLLLRIMADLDAQLLLELFGVKDFLPSTSLLQKLAPGLCKLFPWGCDDVLLLLCGESKNLNNTRMPVYVSQTPAGTSTMNMVHWIQGVKTDAFQMYDYGCDWLSCPNEEHYNQKTPPAYDLGNITVPTALFSGSNDDLADPKDVQVLIDQLPDSTVVAAQQINGFAHLDFVWGMDAHSLVYAPLIKLMDSHASPQL